MFERGLEGVRWSERVCERYERVGRCERRCVRGAGKVWVRRKEG